MELLDGKWFEKFFYFHFLPLCRDELTLGRGGPGGNMPGREPGAWKARTVN
jgi:hypothetical protein